jgi:hypothetical protein
MCASGCRTRQKPSPDSLKRKSLFQERIKKSRLPPKILRGLILLSERVGLAPLITDDVNRRGRKVQIGSAIGLPASYASPLFTCDQGLEEILIPEELGLVWEIPVCELVDGFQNTALLGVESTGRHVDVLGLGLELAAATCACPLFRGQKE